MMRQALEPLRGRLVNMSIGPALAALLVLSCGSSDAGNAVAELGVSESPALDFTKFDVQWRAETVVLDDVTTVQHALIKADLETGELVFDPNYSGLPGLAAGTAALIGGIGAS